LGRDFKKTDKIKVLQREILIKIYKTKN